LDFFLEHGEAVSGLLTVEASEGWGWTKPILIAHAHAVRPARPMPPGKGSVLDSIGATRRRRN
jgi:hypothetical protein